MIFSPTNTNIDINADVDVNIDIDIDVDIKVDTKVLVDAAAVAERGSASLEVMQVVLAASMAFDLIDRFTAFNMNVDTSVPDWMVGIRLGCGSLLI